MEGDAGRLQSLTNCDAQRGIRVSLLRGYPEQTPNSFNYQESLLR